MGDLFKNFVRDRSGNFAVLTAVLAVPVLLGVSIALDMQRSNAEIGNLQDALDSATLSAVMKGSMSKSARGTHAKTVFKENYTGRADVSLWASVTDDRVTLEAQGALPTSLASMIGKHEISVSKSSTAELVQETTTCLLVLAKHNEKALVFEGDAAFNSPNCAIQVNSDHPQALWGGSNRPPVAKDICVTGGYSGQFSNHVKTDCRPVADPYEDKTLPEPGPCETFPNITQSEPFVAGSHFEKPVMVWNKTSKHMVLSPGHYCGGIKFNGKVDLKPGVYHISDGALVLGKTANVIGDDVTFILRGKDARLHMQKGAKADIKASHEGELGGIAFYQVPSGAEWPESQSLVRSGGDLTVNGVFYFPAGDLHVQGTARVGAKAQATSFIAHTLKIDADVQTTINVDHRAAGLPPLMPRTDEGARLVSSRSQ